MPPTTPYTEDLGDREPIAAMRVAIERYRSLTRDWTPLQFEKSYAPGKWSARQILTHLAQTELAFGSRARMALTTPGYVAQSFDQDRWMARESSLEGPAALDALVSGNAINRALFESLSPADCATPFSHPEYGSLTVDWLIHQMAGHLLHHLTQFEIIAR